MPSRCASTPRVKVPIRWSAARGSSGLEGPAGLTGSTGPARSPLLESADQKARVGVHGCGNCFPAQAHPGARASQRTSNSTERQCACTAAHKHSSAQAHHRAAANGLPRTHWVSHKTRHATHPLAVVSPKTWNVEKEVESEVESEVRSHGQLGTLHCSCCCCAGRLDVPGAECQACTGTWTAVSCP